MELLTFHLVKLLLRHKWKEYFSVCVRARVFFLLYSKKLDVLPEKSPRSSRKQAAAQSSLARGWTRTRWNWSQTGGSRAASIWPASWNNKANPDSNVPSGENQFLIWLWNVPIIKSDYFQLLHLSSEDCNWRGDEGGSKINTIKKLSVGKPLMHYSWLSWDTLHLTEPYISA